jgi:autotransporter-associated beta strand protein
MKNLITNSATRTAARFGWLLVTLLAASAPAAVYYWDPNGALAPTSDTWDTTRNQWSTTSALTASPVAWNSANAAAFVAGGTDPGTITIAVNSAITTAGIYNGSLTGISGVTSLDFNGTGSLNFTGIQSFSVAAGKSTSFDVPLTGNGIFTAEGAGDMYFRAANTYSGGTYLGYTNIPFTGSLHFDNPSYFGPGTITVTNTTGGRATLAAGAGSTIANAVNIMSSHTLALDTGRNTLVFSGNIGGGGALVGDVSTGYPPGVIEFDAAMTLTGTTTITNGTLQMGDGSSKNGNVAGNIAVTSSGYLVWANPGAVTYSKVMSGNGTFTYQGPGVLTLSGANTYSGKGYINAGTVKLGINNALPAASVLAINAGANLDMAGYSTSVKGLTDGYGGPGTVNNSSTNTSTLTLANSVDANFSGTIADGTAPVGLTKSGAATQVLSGSANTYSGMTTVNAGILQPGADNAFSPNSSVYLPGPGILDLQYHSVTIGALSGIGIVSNFWYNTLTVSGNAAANGSQDFNRYSCILNPFVGYDNVSLAAGTLVKGGTHAMTIRTNLTASFSGCTLTLSQGTLSVGGGNEMLPLMSLTVPSGATFQLDGNIQTLSSLNGNGKVNLGGGTLNITQNGEDTFSGAIQNSDLAGSSTATGHGLRGYYFTNIDFTGLAAVRDDSTVNLTNMATLPWGYVDNVSKTNQISGRWLGQVLTTVAGTYAFVPATDDGQRLWVNGVLMVNDWTTHGITPKTNTLPLLANTRYDIVFEWFNNGGPGGATLSWMPPGSTVPTIIPTANLFLPSPGTLVMNGSGIQHLNAASTFAGRTIVGSGTLDVQVNGALGSSSVTVSNGAALNLDSTAAMNSGADLIAAAGATVNLNFTGSQTIRGLSLDGGSTWKATGTYNHASNPTVFQGNGSLSVVGAPTSVSLVSSPVSTAVYGTPVTLTATLNPTTATGTVSFYDGANWLATSTVASHVATLTVSNLMVSAAGHSLTAVYNGDATHSSGTSSPITFTTTPATLTLTLQPTTRAYDATTTNFTIVAPGLSGVLPDDTNYVYLQTTSLSLSVQGKGVGTKTATLASGSRTLGGSLATNYVVSTGTVYTTATITNKYLTLNGLTAGNKTYDGTTAATITSAALQPTENAGTGTGTDGKPYLYDSVSLSGSPSASFDTKNIGTGKTVTVTGYSLTGTDATNYFLASVQTTTANITAKALTITGITGANTKTYDATTTATLAGTAALSGVVSGDSAALGGTMSATFADKNAGSGKTVTVTGYTVTGTDASNYTLTQPGPFSATINAASTTLTITASANPASPGSSVTLTFKATANPIPSAPDAPTGTMSMSTNSVNLTAPNVVSNAIGVAVATFTSSSWNLGANTIKGLFNATSGGNYKSSTLTTYTLTVGSGSCSATNRILSVTPNANNTYTLNLIGSQGATYYLLSSASPATSLSIWQPVYNSTNTVGAANGLWSFTPTNKPPIFFRCKTTTPCP